MSVVGADRLRAAGDKEKQYGFRIGQRNAATIEACPERQEDVLDRARLPEGSFPSGAVFLYGFRYNIILHIHLKCLTPCITGVE